MVAMRPKRLEIIRTLRRPLDFVFQGYFSLVGWVAKRNLLPSSSLRVREVRDWGHVAVLGRGASVSLILAAGSRYHVIILCNFEDADLQDAELLDFLSKQKLIVLANIVEPVFSSRLLRRLNVVGVVWAGFMDGRSYKGRKRKRLSGRLNRVGREVEGLPPDFSAALLQRARGTGILGVALAALRSSKVDVFGVEFYTSDYITGPVEDVAPDARELKEKSAALRASFSEVTRFFESTHFTHWCFNDHNLAGANLSSYVFPPQPPGKG